MNRVNQAVRYSLDANEQVKNKDGKLRKSKDGLFNTAAPYPKVSDVFSFSVDRKLHGNRCTDSSRSVGNCNFHSWATMKQPAMSLLEAPLNIAYGKRRLLVTER